MALPIATLLSLFANAGGAAAGGKAATTAVSTEAVGSAIQDNAGAIKTNTKVSNTTAAADRTRKKKEEKRALQLAESPGAIGKSAMPKVSSGLDLSGHVSQLKKRKLRLGGLL